jgi:tRNA dimethylallyltransferase
LSSTRVIAVVGPTAVGKSALAEALCLRLGGEVVSADAMQVYRRMDIGTAKEPESQRRVPYWCIDLVEPGEPFSAALYQSASRAAIADIASRERLPVVVGGTGLYVRAALDLMEFPSGEQADNPVREHYEALAERTSPADLHALLRERDPASAELIHPNNVRRVVRALEMLDDGVSYADQSAGFKVRSSLYDARFVGLDLDRDLLYARIDRRVDEMLERGLLDEVQGLLEEGLREAVTASQAIGYKEFVPVIEEGASLTDAVDTVKLATRRYAKRQLTWFRADPRIRWIDVTDLSLDEALDAALGTLD